jgi:hypothetical protein
VPTGQLLGFIMSKRGIEANPTKIGTIIRLGKPESLKDA